MALIEYCEDRGRMDDLLTVLNELRPEAYREQFGLVPTQQPNTPAESDHSGRPVIPGKPLYWVLGAVALLAVMFVGWRLSTLGRNDMEPTPIGQVSREDIPGIGAEPSSTPTVAPTSTTLPTPTVTTSPQSQFPLVVTRTVKRGGVAVDQVLVPAGSFMMGSEEGEEDERPVYKVVLDAFWIDQTEVTNAQFASCVAQGVCQPPSVSSTYTRDQYYGNEEFADYPVIYISWFGASDFCGWAGGRLPTEAEWEYAARGPESLTYPWGNTFDGQRLNHCDMNCPFDFADHSVNDRYEDTAPVGSYADGMSWVGAHDMAGNVFEWVNDWYRRDYYGTLTNANQATENPQGPVEGESRVFRGGAWFSNSYNARSSVRGYSQPDVRPNFLGFRCAQR
jgi:serine/threonine-protein kinase